MASKLKDPKKKDEDEEEEEEEEEDEQEEEEDDDKPKPKGNEVAPASAVNKAKKDEEDEEEEEEDADDEEMEKKVEQSIPQESKEELKNKAAAQKPPIKENTMSAKVKQTGLSIRIATDRANEDKITFEDVKPLLECSIEDQNRDEIINMLMTTKVLSSKKKKQKKINPDFNLTSTTKTHKENAKSQYNWNTLKSNNTRPNFHQLSEDLPVNECIIDFNTAKLQIYKELKESEDEVYQLLVPTRERENIDKKIEAVKPEQIKEKVKAFYEKKTEKIETIKSKIDDKHKEDCTFIPKLISEKNPAMSEKRNIEQFIKDQENHLKQVENNNKLNAEDREKKLKKDTTLHPAIDPNSVTLAMESRKKNEETDKVAGIRLYKKRNNKQQKLLNAEKEENHLEKLNKIEVLGSTVKANDYEISLTQKMNKNKTKKGGQKNTEYIKERLYKKGIEDQAKVKEELLGKILNEETKVNEPSISEATLINSRLCYTKFVSRYEEIIEHPITEIEMFDEKKVTSILEKFGMIMFKENEQNSAAAHEEDTNEDNTKEKDNDKKTELILLKKLCTELSVEIKKETINMDENQEEENVEEKVQKKTDSSTISSSDLLYFLLTLGGLRNYHLIKNNCPDDSKIKLGTANKILAKVEEADAQSISSSKEYTSRKEDGTLIITQKQAQKIKNHFAVLYLNMIVNQSFINKNKQQEPHDLPYQFKPEINSHSKEIYSNFLAKLNENENNEDQNLANDRMAYIERLIMKKKRKENEYQKQRVNQSELELEKCTFKPELSLTKDYYKSLNKEETINSSKAKRFEQLHQIGTQRRLEKKNVDKIEIEFSKNENHCTFEPNLTK